MPTTTTFRLPTQHSSSFKGVISIEGGAESRTCEGETIIVKLHGSLIATARGPRVGMRISIHVYLTDKRAKARIVYADP